MKINIKTEEYVDIVSDDFGSVTLTLNDKGEFIITATDVVINESKLPIIKVVNPVVDVATNSNSTDVSTKSEEVIVINNEAIQSEENIALIKKMEALANFKYVDLNPKKINKTK